MPSVRRGRRGSAVKACAKRSPEGARSGLDGGGAAPQAARRTASAEALSPRGTLATAERARTVHQVRGPAWDRRGAGAHDRQSSLKCDPGRSRARDREATAWSGQTAGGVRVSPTPWPLHAPPLRRRCPRWRTTCARKHYARHVASKQSGPAKIGTIRRILDRIRVRSPSDDDAINDQDESGNKDRGEIRAARKHPSRNPCQHQRYRYTRDEQLDIHRKLAAASVHDDSSSEHRYPNPFVYIRRVAQFDAPTARSEQPTTAAAAAVPADANNTTAPHVPPTAMPNA